MKTLFFTAVWCPSCLVMRPRWEKILVSRPDVQNEYVDIDEDAEKASQFGITSKVPMIVLLNEDNKEISRIVGEKSEKELVSFLE